MLQTLSLDPEALDEFYRYFRISKMAQFRGVPGATFIGNQRRSTASLDSEDNVLKTIARWVEEGTVSDTITGMAEQRTELVARELGSTSRRDIALCLIELCSRELENTGIRIAGNVSRTGRRETIEQTLKTTPS